MFRKNTASQFIHFQGVDISTGGIKSGVTWTVRRCIDGTFAAGGGTVTEDSTNGWYKYAMSQADTNGNDIGFNFTGTGAVPQTVNIVTTAADPTDAVHFGLSALPNTACTTNASLITSGSGTDQLTVSGGLASSDAKKINAVSTSSVTTVNANIGMTQPVNFTGTAGSALVKSDMVDIAGAAVSTSTAQIGVNAVNWAGGTIPAVNVTGVPLVDLKYTLGTISPATAGSVRADSVTGAVGSVTGAVGSVTGAVGSVTGNVGGNVVGSVGSLTTNNDKTGYSLTSAYDIAKGNVAMTESYASLHTVPTLSQLLFEIRALLAEKSVGSTTLTTKKIDGSTTAETFTLNDATTPTAITRAS